MTDYIFEIDSGGVRLYSDIYYITDSEGNRIAYDNGYVIADWSVVPIEMLLGRTDYSTDSGSIELSGSSINFKLTMPIVNGSILFNGTAVSIIVGRYLSLQPASIRVAGSPIAFNITGTSNTNIPLASGVVRIDGSDVEFPIARVFRINFVVSSGSVSFHGSSLGFKINEPLQSGSITLSGTDIVINKLNNRIFNLDSGVIGVDGRSILVLFTPKLMFLGEGNVLTSGSSIDFIKRYFTLSQGGIVIEKYNIIFSFFRQQNPIELLLLRSIVDFYFRFESDVDFVAELTSEVIERIRLDGNFYR